MTRRSLLVLSLAVFVMALANDPQAEELAQPTGAPSGAELAQAPPAEQDAGKGESRETPSPESALPLRAAILNALQHNLDIELARTEPAVAAEAVEQASGAFDPLASASYSFAHDELESSNVIQGNVTVNKDARSYDAGFSGLLPFGLTYSSGYSLHRTEDDSQATVLAREWRAGWESEVALPLLRDFLLNEANVTVKRSRIAKKISDEKFRETLTDLIVDVENAYWDLAAAGAEERVAHKSLQTARDLLQQTRVQYEVGVVSRVAVTQAEAGVAERELNAIVAENRSQAAQDTLLNLVLAPDAQVYAAREIVPEPALFTDYPVETPSAIAVALGRRPELAQARRAVEDAELQVDFAENQRRPRLDLVASYDIGGLSGTGKSAAETFTGTAGPELGSSRDAYKDFFRAGGEHSWALTGRVEVPIGNTTARSRAVQRKIELRRAKTALRRQEQEIILQVRESVRELRSSVGAVEAAQRRRAAVEESLRIEQERLRLGHSTPFQVLEFEEDLAEAERQSIAALQTRKNAITALERAQGTLLEARSISIEEELSR